MAFGSNVFVNCPFDDDYRSLLRPLVFAIIDLGMTPRIALEPLDSGVPRIEKIIGLIEESKYAIHDLSRIQAGEAGEYYRLNMPLELGLDVGCRLFGKGRWSAKKCLILETEKYRYQAAISDLSNSDIVAHGDRPIDVVAGVRDWLSGHEQLHAPGPSMIWGRFLEFMGQNYKVLRAEGFAKTEIDALPIWELIVSMQEWRLVHPPRTRKTGKRAARTRSRQRRTKTV